MRKFCGSIGKGIAAVAVSIALLLAVLSLGHAGDGVSAQPAPSTDLVVQNLMAANARRAAALRGYRSKRVYNLEYSGLFGGHAEMQVEATYRAPNNKEFKVISESGSKLLIRQVLQKLLQSESEAQEERNRKALEISPANYIFKLENTEHSVDGDFYVLSVKPRSKSKYVYNGRIWVDARDYAIARMEGSPASNPSFWVKNIQVQYQWAKISGFWLPVHNYSVTSVRLGGRAVLNISYSDYQVSAGSQAPAKTADKNPVLPDPSTLTLQPHF
jgi:outer membrane lipoprotein-sorting protein